MLDRARVTLWLHRLVCIEGYEGFAVTPAGQVLAFIAPEPYLWPVFFAIDGRDTLIRSPDDTEGTGGDLVLGGRPSIIKTTGAPDNMGAHGFTMESGDEARIPGTTGSIVRESPALRLPFPCDPLRPEGVLGTVGVAVGLFDHDELPHDSIRAGYDTFATALGNEIADLIDGTPIIGAGNLSQGELDGISERIGENVRATIMSSLSTWELLSFGLGFSDADDEIGSAVFTADLPGLVEDVARVERRQIVKPFPRRGPQGQQFTQRWEIELIAIATRMRADDAVLDVAAKHGAGVADPDAANVDGPWIGPWGDLLGELHAPLLAAIVLDPGLAPAAAAMVADARAIASDPACVVSAEMAERACSLLGAIGGLGDRRARLLAGRARRLAQGLAGHPASIALAARPPARAPRPRRPRAGS